MNKPIESAAVENKLPEQIACSGDAARLIRCGEYEILDDIFGHNDGDYHVAFRNVGPEGGSLEAELRSLFEKFQPDNKELFFLRCSSSSLMTKVGVKDSLVIRGDREALIQLRKALGITSGIIIRTEFTKVGAGFYDKEEINRSSTPAAVRGR